MIKFLFVCVENSCRSQIAEGICKIKYSDKIEAQSCGSKPSGVVNPKAIQSMTRIGYDLSGHQSKATTEIEDIGFDAIITMGCGDACPSFPAKYRYDWAIPDPKHMNENEFDAVRDSIAEKIEELVEIVAKGNSIN